MRVLTRSFRVARVQPFNRMHFQPIHGAMKHAKRVNLRSRSTRIWNYKKSINQEEVTTKYV